ncbi:glycosyltransferase family 2 protein [Arthrobacter halodurans]|uniref:glycosyltransferase family 2 protein n=1 Tax=Arthrobacter halodurans TaxID=516699 RepID=UPI00403B1C77
MHSHVRVTAVVVAHDGARYLPGTLEALIHQTRPVDVYLAVDASSSDDSARLLREWLPEGTPIAAAAARGFGHSVNVATEGRLPEPSPLVQDWIWLIHDDSAPRPDALEHLLASVETTPSVTIAGCKQVDRDAPRHLIDVGLSISGWGERLAMIDVDELDQGQYDRKSDSFAVNSAGMLVRRDAWELLGGFDPALPGLGDDLDLCWRNRLAGHRVVVVPRATMLHAADAVRSVAGPVASRRAEVYLRLKHVPAWQLPFVAAGAVFGGIFRFFASLLAKDPAHAVGQLGATLAAVLSPVQLFRSRRSAARTRRVARGMVRPLVVPRRDVWSHRRHLLEGVEADAGATENVVGDGSGSTSEASNPSGDNNDDFAALAAPQRTSAGVGALLAVAAALAVSLIGLRGLIGAPAVSGGSLLPLSPGPAGIWSNATDWWQSLGSGRAGGGDPFDAVLLFLSVLGLGQSNAAVVTLVLAAMPLAALLAWIALGAVTGSRSGRLLGALLWGLSPSLQVALGSGRPGALVAHVAIPLVALGAIRAVGAARDHVHLAGLPVSASRAGVHGVPSWTAAAGASLALAALTAASPALLAPAVLLTVGFALGLGRRARALWWVPLPSLALAAPLFVAAAANPRVLFADPGVPRPFDAAPLWQQALGFPVAFDAAASVPGLNWAAALVPGPWALAAAVVVGVPALVLAAVGVLRPGRRGRVARAAWLAGTLTLASGYVAQSIPWTVAEGRTTAAFTGPFVSIFCFGTLLAAAVGFDALREARTRSAPASRAGTAGLAVAVVASGAAVAAASMLWLAPRVLDAPPAPGPDAASRPVLDFGAAQQVAPSPERTLPATAADRGSGPFEDRVLVIEPGAESALRAGLAGGTGTTLDDLTAIGAADRLHGPLLTPEPTRDDDAGASLRATVAALVSGESIDPRGQLARLGASFVVLRETGASSAFLAGQLDAVPGLAPVGLTDSGWLWRVQPEAAIPGADGSSDFTARVRVVDASGTTARLVASDGARVDGVAIPGGGAGRHVVLAERADPGWSATLDGRPLAPTALGWAQAFELPEGSGVLDVGYASPWAAPIAVGQAVVFGVVLLLVVPIPQRRRFAPRRVEEYRTTGTAESLRDLDEGDETDDEDGGDGDGWNEAEARHGAGTPSRGAAGERPAAPGAAADQRDTEPRRLDTEPRRLDPGPAVAVGARHSRTEHPEDAP